MAEPLLSVVVTVYNHRNYIEKCLRSIAMQKTDFDFEVLVGEDCSPDGTAEVIERLRPELPDYFNLICREKNMGAVANGADLFERVRGKYILNLEGDDFLLYDGKLQEQVEFLETHPDYSAVATNCIVVGEDSEPNGEKYPECIDDEYSFREYFYSCLPGHSGTIISHSQQFISSRNAFLEGAEYDFYPGDRRNAFTFLVAGKVKCIQKPYGAYRHVKKGGSSYSANIKRDARFARNEVLFGKALVTYAEKYGNAEAVSTAKQVYYKNRFRWCFGPSKYEGIGVIMSDLMKEDHKLTLLTAPVRWVVVLLSRALRGRAIT